MGLAAEWSRLVNEARGWIADCVWREDLEVDDLSDAEVVRGVNRHYSGGWGAFVRDVGSWA